MSRKLLNGKERTDIDKAMTNGTFPKNKVLSGKVLNDYLGSRVKHGNPDFFEHFYKRTKTYINDKTESSAKLACLYIPYLITYVAVVIKEGNELFAEEIEDLFYLKERIHDLLTMFDIETKELDRYLDAAQSMIKETFPDKYAELVELEEAAKATEQIEETPSTKKVYQMREETETLRKQTAELETDKKRLQEEVDRKKETITRLQGQVKALEEEAKQRSAELKKSQKAINDQKKENEELSRDLMLMSSDYSHLQEETNQKIADQREQIRELKSIEKRYNHERDVESQKEVVKERLIEILLGGQHTLESLKHALSITGYEVTTKFIQECLNELSATFNVEKNTTNIPTTYRICKKRIIKDREFRINAPLNGSFETLIISDVHANLDELDKAKKAMDVSYDYATNHGIQQITNLGDLFEINVDIRKILTYVDTITIRKLVKEVSEMIPHVKNMSQGILGGNHCYKIAQSGIDPITELERIREDILDFGYEEATLSFGRPTDSKSREKISLIHPMSTKDIALFSGARTKPFTGPFDPSEFSREDSYMTLIGHTHMGKFFIQNGLYLVPSITRDRLRNGAVHMKVNFDENGLIKSIELLPLANINDKLMQISSEMEYVRKR